MSEREKHSTGAQVRGDVNHGLTADKTPGFDPAAAPLETDSEAGGVPLSGDRADIAREAPHSDTGHHNSTTFESAMRPSDGAPEATFLEPAIIGLKGQCPRCRRGRLFEGYLKVAQRCDVCGLDYSFADPADGPAFFAMSIVAVPALAFALWLQLTYEPPVWVHALTTLPLTLGACLLLLRPLKGWLVCSQYVYKAQEGQINPDYRRNKPT